MINTEIPYITCVDIFRPQCGIYAEIFANFSSDNRFIEFSICFTCVGASVRDAENGNACCGLYPHFIIFYRNLLTPLLREIW